MHGRLKVRTTEEERERKKKEHALKVRAYKAAMAKIQKKREHDELDDEMLQLSVQILLRNPDVTKLWNVRRECVLRKVQQLMFASVLEQPTKAEAQDDTVPATDGGKITTTDDQLQAIYANELSLTEQCLMVNPKSYNSWHHRCWTLEQNPNADWQREVQLCTKYLKLDERNFHTWDYRRYVTKKAGVSESKELDFCTEKIKVNFSNYSSWHHRSLLLPVLYPYEGNVLPKRPMSEELLKKELEMVLTAAFTDPNDSSAWFYQRWLLGYSRAELAVCAFRCNKEKAVLAFTKPLEFAPSHVKLFGTNGETILELNKWNALSSTYADTTWICALPTTHPLNITSSSNHSLEIFCSTLGKQTFPLLTSVDSLFYFKAPNGAGNYSEEVLLELHSQLDSCQSLLEYEPDSKWTLLTSSLLMRAIDAEHYHEKSLNQLQQLEKVDALRKGYYQDLASKWSMEQQLAEWCKSTNIPSSLDLSTASQMKSIHYPQYLSIVDEVFLGSELEETYSKKNSIKTFKQLTL